MLVHFYTAFRNIEELQEGLWIQVWNKSEASESDLQVSLHVDEYFIEQINDTTFSVLAKRVIRKNN